MDPVKTYHESSHTNKKTKITIKKGAIDRILKSPFFNKGTIKSIKSNLCTPKLSPGSHSIKPILSQPQSPLNFVNNFGRIHTKRTIKNSSQPELDS